MQTSVHPPYNTSTGFVPATEAPPRKRTPLDMGSLVSPGVHAPITSAPPPAPYTLHFVEWQCGHHQSRPDDIPVQTPAQAVLIARAIAAAISQPGSGRAMLMDETHGISIYFSDDYVSSLLVEDTSRNDWLMRPCVIHGSEEELTRIQAPEFDEARDWAFGGDVKRWNGVFPVSATEIVLSTSTPEQIMANYVQGIDLYETRRDFELPPTFRTAADVLAEFAEMTEDATGASDGSEGVQA